MPETLVLCGEAATAATRAPNVLRFDVDSAGDHPSKVNLRIDQLSKSMAAEVPDRLTDLLQLACYVFCADQFMSRGGPRMRKMGADWRRRFRFRIPVSDLSFWTRPEVVACLEETLSFLSEDDYVFEFVSEAGPTGRAALVGLQPYLDFDAPGSPAGFRPDTVALFSGGLDSFTGAAELLLQKDRQAALVSHRSSTMVRSKQSTLVAALRERTRPSQLFEVGLTVNTGREEAKDFTQRSRSFLFASIGFVVARLFRKSELTFFENGIVSLNLPVSEHEIGARATRTTHPMVLAGFSQLFSYLAGEEFRAVNPFFWMTKTQVLQRLSEVGCADLLPSTFSCTRVREATRRSRHCGACSQCIDRRFAVLAAGLGDCEPSDVYAVDLFLAERKPGSDLTLAESYVLTASKFATMSESAFLNHYGQVYRALPYLEGGLDLNAARLHQMHVRHGRDVDGVIASEMSAKANLRSALDLPKHCLLSMIQSAAAPQLVDIAESEPPASVQAGGVNAGNLERPIRFGIDEESESVIFSRGIRVYGPAFRLVNALKTFFEEDRAANRTAGEHRYRRTEDLADHLQIDRQTLRQYVSRMRRSLEKQFLERFDAPLQQDDVIQNDAWHGYRLNPYLAPTPIALLLD